MYAIPPRARLHAVALELSGFPRRSRQADALRIAVGNVIGWLEDPTKSTERRKLPTDVLQRRLYGRVVNKLSRLHEPELRLSGDDLATAATATARVLTAAYSTRLDVAPPKPVRTPDNPVINADLARRARSVLNGSKARA